MLVKLNLLPFTSTRVNVTATVLRMPGREGFSAAQNAALRAALKEYRDAHTPVLSQEKLGEELGIGQQAASRIISKGGGMSYATATKIAMLSGFRGVDDFFEDRGLAPWEKPRGETDPLTWRAHAIRLARQLGADEEAIMAARAATGLEQLGTRPWFEMIMRHSDEIRAMRDRTAPAREEQAEKKRRRGKKNAA